MAERGNGPRNHGAEIVDGPSPDSFLGLEYLAEIPEIYRLPYRDADSIAEDTRVMPPSAGDWE